MSDGYYGKQFDLPPELFGQLIELARREDIPTREAAYTIIRKTNELLGFRCKHDDIRFVKAEGKNHGKPYCAKCFARMERTESYEPTADGTNYEKKTGFREQRTFMDDLFAKLLPNMDKKAWQELMAANYR